MSATGADPADLEKLIEARVEALLAERLDKALEARLAKLTLPQPEKPGKRVRRVAIIASKGTLDMAYPPLILATAAAAMDAEVTVFFTFYGLTILCKDKVNALQVAPIANPAMPMPVPVPNIIGMLPGMTPMATKMMKSMFKAHNVETIPSLLNLALESDVKLIGCQMTMDVLGFKKEDFIDGVEIGGAATFMKFAFDADVSLFI